MASMPTDGFTGHETATQVTPTSVVYHGTEVARLNDNGTVTLKTGGWWTATTKRRMCQAARKWGHSWNVAQCRFDWSVYSNAKGYDVPFETGELTFHPATGAIS